MEKELDYLGGALDDPKRPFIAILGGSKISGKIDVIEALLPKVDGILIGGAMACTFYKAMGFETGKSLVEADRVEMAKDLIERAGSRLILPHDATVATAIAEAPQGARREARWDPRGRSDARHRSRVRAELRARDPRGQDDHLERADGCVRDAAVRCGHDAQSPPRWPRRPARVPSPSSAVVTRRRRWSKLGWVR
ncbi:MAG: phosphoglycerate kinase [Gemmatimonadaceae bacterium]|nr:phosphoglycerate kinase [Gemmatimonadaceae bacterium]